MGGKFSYRSSYRSFALEGASRLTPTPRFTAPRPGGSISPVRSKRGGAPLATAGGGAGFPPPPFWGKPTWFCAAKPFAPFAPTPFGGPVRGARALGDSGKLVSRDGQSGRSVGMRRDGEVDQDWKCQICQIEPTPAPNSRFVPKRTSGTHHVRGVGKFPGKFAICDGPSANCLRCCCRPAAPAGAPANKPNMLSRGTAMRRSRCFLRGGLKNAGAYTGSTPRPRNLRGCYVRRTQSSSREHGKRANATAATRGVCAAATQPRGVSKD